MKPCVSNELLFIELKRNLKKDKKDKSSVDYLQGPFCL